MFTVTTTIPPRTPTTPAGDIDNIDHSPDALGNQGRSNRDVPDHVTPHSTGPHHPPLLPPTTIDSGHLPNTFILGLHLTILIMVHLGLHSRQRALQLWRTIYDVREGEAFRRISHPQKYHSLLGPCASETYRTLRKKLQPRALRGASL